MSDADTAYQIAEQRIARAKETGARVLSLSPHYAEDGRFNYDNTPELSALDRFPPAIADLIDLQALYLWGTKVEDISHLAGMTAMQTLHLNGTKVEDISHLAGMTAMQTLILNSTKVEDISHLAGMTAMQTLHLNGTKVEDISHLAGMIAMQTLYLGGTKVEDISHLAGMTAMQRLDLDGTKVEDISHLAGMTAMQRLDLDGTKVDLHQLVAEGASWADEDRALRNLWFENTPATQSGECLEGVYDANDGSEARTNAALAALRAERDRRKAKEPEPPEPAEGAVAFSSDETGKVIIAETTSPVSDPTQDALQEQLLRAARELAALLDGDNQFGALAQDAAGYAALLSHPATEIAAKALWPLDVRLRNALTADQAADEAGRLNEMLPPLARSALEGVVAIGAPWLQDHPGYQTLVEALKRHVADETEEAEVEASASLIDALEPPKVAENVEEATLAVGQAARKAAFDPGPIGRKTMAKKSLLDYARGFTVYLLNAPLKALKWSDGAFVWVSTRAAGVLVARQLLMALEPTLKPIVAQYLPNYAFYFQKLMEALRAMPF